MKNSYHTVYHDEHGPWCETPICPIDDSARVQRLETALELVVRAMDAQAKTEIAQKALDFEKKLYEDTRE